MEQIQALLAEMHKMQDQCGVRRQDESVAVADSTPDLVSRNSLDTFMASYRRFRGRFLKPDLGPKLSARVWWAICDETKFEGLIKTLKDFVDDLFFLVPVERSVLFHIVEEDIMAVTDLVNLEIIRDASENEYQAWSDVASRAVGRTEGGTVPCTDVQDEDPHSKKTWVPRKLHDPTKDQIAGEIFDPSE